MRRSWLVFLCVVYVQLALPPQANAWWEYIEALSGPKLNGPHFDWRILCFMEKRTDEDQKTLEQYMKKDWGQPRPDTEETQDTQGIHIDIYVPGVIGPCLTKAGLGSRRRFSIDLGVRYLRDKSFGPANGNTVKFVTVEPAFTWNVFRKPTRDVVDASGGIGAYWFFSDAFPTFNGLVVDPRLDVHVPTVVRRLSRWTTLIPTARAGVLLFPKGFEKNAFADTRNGFRSKKMDNWEHGAYIGFFFDLESLFPPKDPFAK